MSEYWDTIHNRLVTVNEHESDYSPFVASLTSGINHVSLGIIFGSSFYLMLYILGSYDLAAIVFFVLMAGIFVDLYIHNYYH